MPDLLDGQSAQIQGSASKPYTIKRIAGVYSCSCPAWRNQSLPIDRRTCKHIRLLRGDDAEAAHVGTGLANSPKIKASVKAPPLLLAETWNGSIDPQGWWISEKLDGVRCFWDGKQFLSHKEIGFSLPRGSRRACLLSHSTASCGWAASSSSAP